MESNNRNKIEFYTSLLQSLWGTVDMLFNSFSADDWENKHGAEWKFSDVPFHMAYFDNELIANYIEYGKDLPKDLQIEYETMGQLHDFNQRNSNARSADHSVEDSLTAYGNTKVRIFNLLANMTDEDLQKPAWYRNIVFRGWRTKEWLLGALIAHIFDHIFEMRAQLQTSDFRPSPESVHAGLKYTLELLVTNLMYNNRNSLGEDEIVIVSKFIGEGGSSWTHYCSKHIITVKEEHNPNADFVISMSPETMIEISKGLLNPMKAMESGMMKVEGMEHFPSYGALTAIPKDNIVTEIAP